MKLNFCDRRSFLLNFTSTIALFRSPKNLVLPAPQFKLKQWVRHEYEGEWEDGVILTNSWTTDYGEWLCTVEFRRGNVDRHQYPQIFESLERFLKAI